MPGAQNAGQQQQQAQPAQLPEIDTIVAFVNKFGAELGAHDIDHDPDSMMTLFCAANERLDLNSFNVSKRLSIHPYWFDAGQVPVTAQNVLECHISVAFGGNPDMGPRTILFKNCTGQFLSDWLFLFVTFLQNHYSAN